MLVQRPLLAAQWERAVGEMHGGISYEVVHRQRNLERLHTVHTLKTHNAN